VLRFFFARVVYFCVMPLIETHAHIYAHEFNADRADMLARAQDAGIEKIYMPNIDHTSVDDMLQLELKYPQLCVPMMGLHPCYIKANFEQELYRVEDWLNKRKFAAVGEIGTDLYWDKTFWPQQQEAFKIQVDLAKKHKRPVVIHCRESIDETISLLEPLLTRDLTGIFHCFSGTAEQAQKITAMGFYVGYGGVATFKNGGQDKVIPQLKLDNMVLETDSPYLAPVPHRGKRNEPAYIKLVAKRMAELLGVSIETIEQQTTQNALKVFAEY
jgi:TatD DNase family protein